uniref:hypothetical protein n=1 Tax=Roseburia sp. TaxID=2049040 RepID=UPI003FF07A59
MTDYTCEQILEEIEILKRTFPIVRLVNPLECHVMELVSEEKQFSWRTAETCYHSWDYTYQCINCISARAIQSGQPQSKYEVQDDKPFCIISRPVHIDGKTLALEIVQPIEYPILPQGHNSCRISSAVHNNNQTLLRDSDTPAYNRHYLSEHLPNIMIEAAKTGKTDAAFVRLQNMSDVILTSGPVAASGLIRELYDLLLESFRTPENTPLLVRYDENTFFIYENVLDSDIFEERLHRLPSEAASRHILFQNTRLSFELETASARIGEERISSGEALLNLLKERIS